MLAQRLLQRRVLVTAAGSGIGRAIAIRLHAEVDRAAPPQPTAAQRIGAGLTLRWRGRGRWSRPPMWTATPSPCWRRSSDRTCCR
jgi:hypothetical protein